MIDVSKPTTRTQTFEYEPLGIRVKLTWRVPTTTEMRAYTTDMGRTAAGRETASKDFPFSYGLAILTGIRDGDWGYSSSLSSTRERAEGEGADSKSDRLLPLSSDPASPDYQENWKDLLSGNDISKLLIGGLATAAFQGVNMITREAETPPVPFEKSSGGSKETAEMSVK